MKNTFIKKRPQQIVAFCIFCKSFKSTYLLKVKFLFFRRFLLVLNKNFYFGWCTNIKNLKHYEHNCQQIFLLLFIFLLTALIVKNSYILVKIYVIFLKNVPNQTSKAFNIEFRDLSKWFGKVVIK